MKGVEEIEHSLLKIASPKRWHTFWGLMGVLLMAGIVLWARHGVWLRAPNDIILTEGSDGIKNYMTTAWHVRHDSSYVHYGGMNYPFGEHVLFTDNQPIVSAAMQWWSRHVFDVGNHAIGIVNVLQVLSIILGAGVIYLLLRKLHLPAWYAGVAALGITFLSPQNHRFDTHFGLSHIWVLPMLLLLLCRYEERKSRRYQSLLIGALLLFSAQLHFYNFGVSAIFLGFYTLFHLLIDRSWRNIWTRASHLTVMVLLPFALLNVWLHWSDYCADRSANPYGFTTYICHWEGVFLPYKNFPMHQWIDAYITEIRPIEFESKAYAGFVAFAFTLWLVFKRRFRLFEQEWDSAAYHRVHKDYLRGICFAAFAILIIGLGFPFAIKGLEWLADYVGSFRQFRGLGRFAFGFYYVINVLAFYVLWNKSLRIRIAEKWAEAIKLRSVFIAKYLTSTAKWSIVLMPLMILCWEAYFFQKNKPPRPQPNLALRSVVAISPDHWLNKVDFARFQALMPLPYYHAGSENISLGPDSPLFPKVQYTALQTGVPDMGVNMSRGSIGRMVKSVQFSLLACEPPTLLSEFPDNRPIALMIEPGKWEEVRLRYKHLLDKATPVYDGPELKIMSLVPDSVRSWSEAQARAVSAEMDRVASFDAGGGWKGDKPPKWFAYQNFDSITSSNHVFRGKGAGESVLGDTTWAWNGHIPKGQYTLSIWIKADEDKGMTQELKMKEQNLGDGGETQVKIFEIGQHTQTIVNGWALFEVPFEVTGGNSNMNIFLHKKNGRETFWYDELMIKESGFSLYRREPGWVLRNNFWFKLPKQK